MHRRFRVVSLAFALLIAASGLAEPISKEKLLSLVKSGVDKKVLVALVKKECLDFTVGPDEAIALSQVVPPEVLEAGIECRDTGSRAKGAASSVTLTPVPLKPARVRITNPKDGSAPRDCRVIVDYTGSVKRLAMGWLQNAPKSSWREEFLGVDVREIESSDRDDPNPKPRWSFNGYDPYFFNVPPGHHKLSLYCDHFYKRNDVEGEFEADTQYRVVVRFGVSGGTTIFDIERER